MEKLGWDIKKDKYITRIIRRTKETEIKLVFDKPYCDCCGIEIKGSGDLDHHLIEDVMLVINKLSEIKGVNHKLT